eukprot:TCONS_00058175-protein
MFIYFNHIAIFKSDFQCRKVNLTETVFVRFVLVPANQSRGLLLNTLDGIDMFDESWRPAYSRRGRTNAIKRVRSISGERKSKLLLIRPTIELAFLILPKMCSSKFSSPTIITPRFFS